MTEAFFMFQSCSLSNSGIKLIPIIKQVAKLNSKPIKAQVFSSMLTLDSLGF